MNSSQLARAIGRRCPQCRPNKLLPWKIQQMGFSRAQILRATSPFKMPAMSPTMTEGNIASWKVREGEAFSAGEVLLEIETDKAQMDVEAQDNGILAKILVPDGTQKVNVGKMIAVLAEEGDDISSVEIPAENLESTSALSTSKIEESTSVPKTDHQETKMYLKFQRMYLPAVLRLLQEHNIEDPTKIKGTGPHGRLLKGDLLAYLGTIKSEVPSNLQRILEEKQRLDLSNVVVQPRQNTRTLSLPSKASIKPPPFACIKETVAFTEVLKIQRQLSDVLSIDVSLESLVEKANKQALADVPQFGWRKLASTETVYVELIGDNRIKAPQQYGKVEPGARKITGKSTGSNLPLVPQSIYGQKRIANIRGEATMQFAPSTTAKSRPAIRPPDLLDELLGIARSAKPIQDAPSVPSSHNVEVKLEFDDATIDEEVATAYLARFRYHIEYPSRLVLGL